MGRSIQRRLFSWLVLVVLPIAAACVFTVFVVDNRLTERVNAGLLNDHRLESARIESALARYRQFGTSLSYNTELQTLLARIHAQRIGEGKIEPALSANSSDVALPPIEPSVTSQLLRLTKSIHRNAQMLDAGIVELKVMATDGCCVGQTEGYTWQPVNPTILSEASTTGKPVFGEAYLSPEAQPLFGMVVPVFDSNVSSAPVFNLDRSVIGYLLLEMALGPVVDLVEAHEGLGETSESHIAQATVDGDAAFITLLRFKRDAAFNLVVPKEKNLPINWSLLASERRVVRSPDYRGIDSLLAIGTVPSTGWGLVVKIDAVEALQVLSEIKWLVWIAGCISVLLVILSWFLLVRPLALRIQSTAQAADRVAAGQYESLIQDPVNDEIGGLAGRIDQLASDLKQDKLLRAKAEQQLKYQAQHDALTGLFNRKQIQEVIESLDDARQLSDADATSAIGSKPEKTFGVNSVLFIDLDGFKEINDQHGHHVGDEILVTVASELLMALPNDCHVARWGGDEFVVVLPGGDEQAASFAARQITDRFNSAFSTSAGVQFLGCSIGASTSEPGLTLAECVNRADAHMYAVKQERKQANIRSIKASRFVRNSLDEKRVEVWYQPIIETDASGNWNVIGAEALLRIHDENGDLVAPGEFLPDMHELAISSELDVYVLTKVFSDFSIWKGAKLVSEDFYVSVNLCGPTVRMASLPQFMQKQLSAHALPPESIVLELSEATEVIDLDIVMSIKSIGVRVAVDDVGLSNSNLDRLATISPDIAKIDRMWLSGAHTSKTVQFEQSVLDRKKIVLGHMIAICNDMGMDYVIEGVESNEQVDLLHEIGAFRFQGFLFDAALSPPEFMQKLRNAVPAAWLNPFLAQLKAG